MIYDPVSCLTVRLRLRTNFRLCCGFRQVNICELAKWLKSMFFLLAVGSSDGSQVPRAVCVGLFHFSEATVPTMITITV